MILNTIHSKVLVEEYIEGREFTIGILGNEVLPIVEIISPTGFYDREQKEDLHSEVYRICPADLPVDKNPRTAADRPQGQENPQP